jgi:hypothetical protein
MFSARLPIELKRESLTRRCVTFRFRMALVADEEGLTVGCDFLAAPTGAEPKLATLKGVQVES